METTSTPGETRRRHRRYEVQGVHGSLVFAMDARVLNLSLTGLALETTHGLRVGSYYVLRLPHHDGEIRLRAHVEWCHLVRTAPNDRGEVVPIYHAGLDFREALGSVARDLLGFIEENVVVELERRILGRFRLRQFEPVNLEETNEFEVLRISHSGMLLRTTLCPPVGALLDLELSLRGNAASGTARVAYVRQLPPGEGEKRVELGVEFQRLDEPSRAAIDGLIEALIE